MAVVAGCGDGDGAVEDPFARFGERTTINGETPPGELARLVDVTTMLDTVGGFVDPIYTGTSAFSRARFNASRSISSSWVSRTWSLFGQVGATGGASSTTIPHLYNNPTGAPGAFFQVDGDPSSSRTTNIYRVYANVGEQLIRATTTSRNTIEQTTYRRDGLGRAQYACGYCLAARVGH